MTVTLTGFITVPHDRLDAIRAELVTHIRLTRQEPGCINFDVTEDENIEGRFNVSEEFSSAEAFKAHQARVKVSDWGAISAGIPRSYEITGLPDDQ